MDDDAIRGIGLEVIAYEGFSEEEWYTSAQKWGKGVRTIARQIATFPLQAREAVLENFRRISTETDAGEDIVQFSTNLLSLTDEALQRLNQALGRIHDE